MQALIISPQDKKSFAELKSIILPAFAGELQVLPGHAESFIMLKQGEIILQGQGKIIHRLPIKTGVGHIQDDLVKIIL